MLNKKDSELEMIFFIENKYYLKSKITDKENISEKEVLELFQKNILCEGKNKEIKFEYVGIISLEKSCLIILPKYLKQENFENIKFEYGKFIYKIIGKYSKNIKTNEINIYDGEEENNFFQKLPLYKYLIEFFHNNGLYEREKEITEINGDGEISWEKTIEESEMFLDNGGNPFYFDMHTQEYVNDEVHYIRELHKFLLNKASLYLKSFSKISGENYNEIYFPVNEHLFDDDNLIIINLERELHETFDEKNLNLLKTMKILVEEKDYNFNSDIYFFGTKSFYNVWEVALQEFFGHDKNNNLIKEFVPRWKNLLNGNTENGYPIIPDIIKIVDKTFYLFDAKYYDTDFTEDRIKNSQPKTYDIAKQFMYLECCKRLKDRNEIKYKYINAFLMPEDDESFEIKKVAEISFEIFDNEKIHVFKLNAKNVFEKYFENARADEKYFENILNESEKNL